MLTDDAASCIDDCFKNRWRTLMSVDDVIAGVMDACAQLGVANDTYFFYSSDHGFQLGQFNIPMDKRCALPSVRPVRVPTPVLRASNRQC